MVTMKKRMLALALTLTIIVGLGGQAWAEVLPGVESTSPEVSTQPENSASTEGTEAPQETTAPEETDAPEESTAPEETTVPEESETPEEPVETPILDEAYALPGVENFAVTEAAPEVEPYTELPSGTAPYQDLLVNSVSPSGTTIDLFDYWLTEQEESDYNNPRDMEHQGINNGHALLFGANMGSSRGTWNEWTGSGTPRTGIVQSELENGYPKLDGNRGYTGGTRDESLAYLFDPDVEHSGKASYPDVQGLLQVDNQGYYHYDSKSNYAVYYQNTNSFAVYKYPGITPGGQATVGQFFPFNKATNEGTWITSGGNRYQVMNDSASNDTSLNHYFGVHMSTRFIQQDNGYTDETHRTPVTYEFSGDDDVWIFIDGTLVADLGGIHNATSVSIDFSNGQIRVNGNLQGQRLGRILGYNSSTLPDNTYHTLDFFYLERGNVDSNMSLKYNLVTIPESSLIKVDQIGDAVPGAQFALYAADDRSHAIATGTTGTDGKFVFLDENDFPITIQSLYDDYKDVGQGEASDLILVETGVPEGYRTNGEIGLYFYLTAGDEVLLLTNSVWTEGAYAMPKVTATTPNVIRSADDPDLEVTLTGTNAVENPLMFAVVYQKQGDGTWLPVSGDPLEGWKVQPDNTWNDVIQAATNNKYIFQLASSGAYQVEIENLPGDIRTYFHICKDEDTAQYTIGYYYTTANTVENATADNTWRIDSDPTGWGADDYALDRVFSMDLYVTNIKNRLLVQKVDDAGVAVNGAEFALYPEDQVRVSGDGTVTIPEGAQAADRLTTQPLTGLVEMEGGGVFPTGSNVLREGEYYLVETSTPDGYKLNDTVIHVVVDNTGVYVDAGNAYDGVSVLRGVGSVIRSMVQFAAKDDVDTTLYAIKAALVSSVTYDGPQMTWSPADWAGKNILHLEYANQGNQLDYGPHDPGGKLAIETETGWSKLLIRQCAEHKVDSGSYTDLGEQDITNLFSGTVTVRVENERTGNLEISKTVTAEDDNAPADAEFNFTVTVKNDGTPISGTYKTLNQSNQKGEIAFENGVATVTLQDGQALTILDLPTDAAYTVEETKESGYETTVTVEPKNNGTVDTQNSAKVTGTIPHNTTDTEAVVLDYVNAYKEMQTLTVTKTVDGNMGDTTKDFTFTLQVTDTDGTAYTGDLTATKRGTGVTAGTEEETLNHSNNYEFTLKHDQEIAIDIPQGYGVTVTEAAVDGYTTKWRNYITGTTVTDDDHPFGTIPGDRTVDMTDNYTVDYLNECDMQVPPSGVDAQNPGISVMLGVAAGSAVLIFGCSFLVWRRRRRDWM